MPNLSRRNLLLAGGAAALAALSGTVSAEETPKRQPFRRSLNLGTLLSFDLPLEKEIDIAAQAGYQGCEPWIHRIQPFVERGGKLADIRKRVSDHGLTVEGIVTFFPWGVDDEKQRAAGIEQMKKEMDWALQIGSGTVAATASGMTNVRNADFRTLGDRYRTILEIGDKIGVRPVLEVWGGVQTLNSLADLLAVAAWSGHPKASFLLDVYHLFRGGSPFEGLSLLNGHQIAMVHVNDYPADPPREKLEDKHRLYCGDGIAPLPMIFQTLRDIGYEGCLSFEVFNPSYRATNDPLLVAKTGLEKLNAVLQELH
ncbi:MAG: sugar phosphate isomerase/epimerase [Planctomycetaceae bacterium]|jgi:sugar phosphate isomerase/epimerase|nr:sugar phosphate isomerase/epimerase [Planctomycetaceae bacterium]